MLKVGATTKKNGGVIFDEKGRDQVAGIFVTYDKFYVVSLQFLFFENGNFVYSKIHGRSRDAYVEHKATVVFDYPSECLTSFTGSLDDHYGRLRSISFGTNKGNKHGPFGANSTIDNIHKMFYFHMGPGLFGGFHGSINDDGQIGAIGVYVKLPIMPPSTSAVKEEEDYYY